MDTWTVNQKMEKKTKALENQNKEFYSKVQQELDLLRTNFVKLYEHVNNIHANIRLDKAKAKVQPKVSKGK